MSFIVRLVHGSKIFDLNDGTRFLIEDGKFTPPSADTQLNISSAGNVISQEAQPRKWTFQTMALGSSFNGTSASVSQLQSFLALAGGQEPLYLEYCANPSIPYRPAWGQDGWRRYEILNGQAHFVRYGAMSAWANIVGVDLVIAPYALGLKQAVLTSVGGILEDNLGTEDGAIRGIQVLPATVNLFTNPLFYGENNTYNTGWTATAPNILRSAQGKDFAVFGKWSGLCYTTTAASGSITQSLTATSTNTWVISAYFKREDGAAVTDALVKMFYDTTARTTTFISVGNGWYLGYATVTGVASAKATGIQVQAAYTTVYATGFMFFEGTYPLPFCYGDMPGCSWGGTAHQSATTRAVGYLAEYPEKLFFGDYRVMRKMNLTIRVAFRWWYPSTYTVSYQTIFDNGSFRAVYFHTTNELGFTADGINWVTCIHTFSAGDLVVLHFVCAPYSMKIYKNGVEVATGSSCIGITDGNFLKFGCSSANTDHGCMTFMDLTIWGETATAAEVLADYTNLLGYISADNRINAIPWKNTGAMSMYQDATHNDTTVFGGIPGNVLADTEYFADSNTGYSMLAALHTHDEPVDVTEEFADLSGTVVAGALGGEVYQAAVNTTEVDFPPSGYIQLGRIKAAYYGQPFYIFAVISDAGANLTARLKLSGSTAYILSSDYKSIAADATRRAFLIGPVISGRELPDIVRQYQKSYFRALIGFLRTVSGSANVNLDWYRVMIGKVAYFPTAHASTTAVIVNRKQAIGLDTTAELQTEDVLWQGDTLDLEPGKYNYLTAYSVDLGGAVVNANTLTVVMVNVTPRWKLI